MGCSLSDLASFIAAYPDNALGPFLEGDWRLSKGDGTGLECLERAIALDAGATKPACEKACAYLSEHADPRADAYQQRWKERDRWEQAVAPQLERLDAGHELCDPGLPDDRMATITALVRAHSAGIARAYLARRILPADPAVLTYVLGLELEPAPPRLEMPHDIVERLAQAGTWPMHLLVCALEGKHAMLKARLQALPKAEISLRE